VFLLSTLGQLHPGLTRQAGVERSASRSRAGLSPFVPYLPISWFKAAG